MAPSRALGLNCEAEPISSCIDSNQQWLSFGGGRFVTLGAAEPLVAGQMSLALVSVYQLRPLTLLAPSPDPAGRDIPLVEHVVDTQVLLLAGLGHGFDLGVALRGIPYQSGTGASAVRSRAASTKLAPSAIRDPIVGVGYALPQQKLGAGRLSSKVRVDVSLPLGDAQHFAGEASVVSAPNVVGELSWARLYVAGTLGARFRQSLTLGDVRYGSQLSAGLGVGYEAVRQRLWLASEATLLPGIVPQPAGNRWIQAEWAASIKAQVTDNYAFLLSGGTGLPLSSGTVDFGNGHEQHEYFLGLGVPELRALVSFVVASVPEH